MTVTVICPSPRITADHVTTTPPSRRRTGSPVRTGTPFARKGAHSARVAGAGGAISAPPPVPVPLTVLVPPDDLRRTEDLEEARLTQAALVELDPARSGAVEGARRPGPGAVTQRLFAAMANAASEEERRAVRDELIRVHLPFADFLARRFRHRGESFDDLCQVASIGLIKAIDGFDPERGSSFFSYAVPTILGELRRHFRDKGWNVRVPRRLQELRAEIISLREPLTQRLGRSPSRGEIADELGISMEELDEALLAAQAYSAVSLQAPAHCNEASETLADLLAHEDGGFDVIEARESLRTVLHDLPERERRILGLRFYRQLSQCEIAAELGISQMHVSRLITRSLGTLRMQLAS